MHIWAVAVRLGREGVNTHYYFHPLRATRVFPLIFPSPFQKTRGQVEKGHEHSGKKRRETLFQPLQSEGKITCWTHHDLPNFVKDFPFFCFCCVTTVGNQESCATGFCFFRRYHDTSIIYERPFPNCISPGQTFLGAKK